MRGAIPPIQLKMPLEGTADRARTWLAERPLGRLLRRGLVSAELVRLLAVFFVFSLGVSGWSAVVAGRLAQSGEGTAMLGSLYAVCELTRLPAALLLPLATFRWGPRRIARLGLLALACLPLLALAGLDNQRTAATLVLAAVPSMAVYVGLPAFVIGAAGKGHDGWALALMGLVGGAGGALGPWACGWLADDYGPLPALLVLGASSLFLLYSATNGPLPAPTRWPGWASLAGGLPWRALAALALASAADAGRATLVTTELVRRGLALGDTGLLLGAGCAVAGVGFLAFGRLADRRPPMQVLGAGLLVLVLGSIATASAGDQSVPYAISAAVVGMGASGIRLGAEISLLSWVGRDRAAVAAALGETTMLGGRAVGAPTLGAVGDAHGGASAFWTIGLAGVLASLAFIFLERRAHRQRALPASTSASA